MLGDITTAITELTTDPHRTFDPRGETMSLLRMLDELDQMQRLLEAEFPECKIGYS
jgi:hypothetical protein